MNENERGIVSETFPTPVTTAGFKWWDDDDDGATALEKIPDREEHRMFGDCRYNPRQSLSLNGIMKPE